MTPTRYLPPIVDRSQADIDNETDKAFFNVSDWQRIYGNAQVVHILLEFLRYTDIEFNTTDTPAITDFPTVVDLNSLLANIERMRQAAGLPGTTAIKTNWLAGSSVSAPTYVQVNSWEQVLEYIIANVSKAAEYFLYSGVAAAGQPRFYQHRFRQLTWVPISGSSPVRRERTGLAVTGSGIQRNNSYRRYD